MFPDFLLFTCEHGGNRIPKPYQYLFATPGYRTALKSHRGFDLGALQMARQLSASFAAPLVFSTVSRLLADLNRSIGHPALHSPASRALSAEARRELIDRYYRPYRAQIEAQIMKSIGAGRRVIHVSCHSFAPELDGQTRNADIGLLYDPTRPGEVALALRWRDELKRRNSGLRVRRNYPYAGRNDGLTTALRRHYSAGLYVGLELEINQKHPLQGGLCWTRLRGFVVESLHAALSAKTAGETGVGLSEGAERLETDVSGAAE